MSPTDQFQAFVVEKNDDGFTRQVRACRPEMLGEGEVTVRVEYSSVNYKDGLAASEQGRVARVSPLIPGIDLAGVVVESASSTVVVGERVLAHGYDLGVAHHGGFSEYARLPARWVVPMPAGLDSRTAMAIGTAGFTAALSVVALEERGLVPGSGPVLVTGASGGVGSTAVGILARRGHEVVASTGKDDAADWLRALGAAEVIDRSTLAEPSARPLEAERWAGAVDCVGGSTLASILRSLRYGAAVAASGLTGGGDLPTTVFPFILRGVSLLGIDSVAVSIARRIEMWGRLATDLRPPQVDSGDIETVGLDDLIPVLDAILTGAVRGRTLVQPG
jgi:acrylyl-CoA reductase (NADPH)